MKLFAIGDLHLGHDVQKPMDIFGERWQNHMEEIKVKWHDLVKEEDIVIICGDISWGMRLEEAYRDLLFLEELPGQKICIRGNHDYWWVKIKKLNTLFPSIHFIQNTAFLIKDIAVCGTRGWVCPKDDGLSSEDYKIYLREGERLKLSLKDAIKKGAKNIIVALHYPPTNEYQEPSLFTEIIKEYPVSQVIYGHLHDERAWEMCLKDVYEGVSYKLVAADYLNFAPLSILER